MDKKFGGLSECVYICTNKSKMKKEEVLKVLENVPTPIYQIEKDLGMPPTTLQKAVKGGRVLPKKWAIKLKEAFKEKSMPSPQVLDLTKPNKEVKVNDTPKSNFTINTTPAPDPSNKGEYLKWLKNNK